MHACTELLREAVIGLFEGVCSYDSDFGVFHYGSTQDGWDSWEQLDGDPPEIVGDESLCGRHSVYVCFMLDLIDNYNKLTLISYCTVDSFQVAGHWRKTQAT